MDSEKAFVILLADDDADDREMTRKALARNHLASEFHAVSNGEELMDFLHRRADYAPPTPAPTPQLILLDLNMPKMDGREALAEIKADPVLRRIHEHAIDLLLTDVVMPRMSGLQLAARLQAIRPAIRVLYMTGYAHDTTLAEIRATGATLFQRPITPEALARGVRGVLDSIPHAGQDRRLAIAAT